MPYSSPLNPSTPSRALFGDFDRPPSPQGSAPADPLAILQQLLGQNAKSLGNQFTPGTAAEPSSQMQQLMTGDSQGMLRTIPDEKLLQTMDLLKDVSPDSYGALERVHKSRKEHDTASRGPKEATEGDTSAKKPEEEETRNPFKILSNALMQALGGQ